MKLGTLANFGLFVLNCVLAFVLILTLAALIQERSADIVRVTVPEKDLLHTVGQLQVTTHKVARAYPVNGDYLHATRWRIVIDNKSKSF